MSRIKTAWELALERTADIAIDKEAIHRDEAIKRGNSFAGRYLNAQEEIILEKELEGLEKHDEAHVREGVKETLLANLTLPRTETDLSRLQRVTDGLKILKNRGPGTGNLEHMLKQCHELFTQYLNTISQKEEEMRAGWESILRQKEQVLRKQSGQSFRLAPEHDPEFVKALANQVAALDAHFLGILNMVKDKIRRLL